MGKERCSGINREGIGSAPSRDEMQAIGDCDRRVEKRKKKRKHAKHVELGEVDQAIARDDPSQLEQLRRKHKSKRHRSGKRHKKASNLDSAHSKEEESARTLLEMKGAAAAGNTYDRDGDLILSSQVAAGNQDRGGHVDGRDYHKRKKHKRRKHRRTKEDLANEPGAAVLTSRGSIAGTSHMDESLPTAYTGSGEPTESFHPIPEGRHLPDRFPSSQRTALDDTIVHIYSDVPVYADPAFRAGTPPYSPEASPPYSPGASPSLVHSSEFEPDSPQGTDAHLRKRKDSQTRYLDPQNDDPNAARGRGGKHRKVVDSGEVQNALLADAASAANALIDPILTGQPPLWTIIDGKTAYMGQILNGASTEPTRKGGAGRKSGSRKRRLPAGDLEEDELAAGTQKPKKRTKKPTVPQIPAIAEGATAPGPGQVVMTKGGPFSEHEENLLKRFMEDYRLEHNLTEYELNARIWAERRLNRDDFWDQVSAVLAYRPRQSIYKYCRRQFHNFSKRGQWTPEEDEELIAAAKEHPQQWKIVGNCLNRMPEDCRDRWRNYLKCGEARKRDVWTEQEENRLKQHVREVIVALGGQSRNASTSGEDKLTDDDVDKKAALINWTIVSEKMGGTRSRIQCSYKWKKLQKIAAREKEQAKAHGDRTAVEPQPKKTWRAKRAEGNYFKMLPGDKYDLLKALKDSGTYEEKNIPWKLVGSPELCRTWNLTDRKTAFKFLKQTVPNCENMTLQDIVNELLTGLEQHSPDVLSLHYAAPRVPPKQIKRSEHQHGEDGTEELSDGGSSYHQDGVAAGEGLDSQSGDYHRQLSMEDDRYLGPGVDERMAQQVQLLRNV
ncbi:MAG: RNA polymerase I enhancer binding protein [Geoglossum simile]|nr:MAG: RNA polymerase I enhancer binding protein [Geoglossum simile]